MATELVKHEPIKLPDPRRPATLPSLPEWAARSSAAVRLELQMAPDRSTFRDVLVLPAELMPTAEQRSEMESHIASLRSCLSQTPETSAEYESRVAIAVSKVLTVLGGERKSDLVEEARSEVYLDVLEDVPCWAVEVAVKRWFKHECGADERGRAYDYRWAPDPGTLRVIAKQQTLQISERIGQLRRALDAVQYIDYSADLERGRLAMRGLMHNLDKPNLTFAEAAELGAKPVAAAPAPKAQAAE
jgi:hypothetical protein